MSQAKYVAQIGESSWAKVVIAGLLLAGLYYAAPFDDGTSLRERFENARGRLADSERQLANTKKAMEDAGRFEEEVKTLARQFQRVTDFMPENLDTAELTQIITKQVTTAGAKVTRLEPKPGIETVEFYEMTRINLSIQGTFAQVATFLANLSKVSKLLTFDSTEITLAQSPDPEHPRVNFSGVMVGYRYKKAADAPAASNGQAPVAGAAGGVPHAP
jgi:Tfp pilus assembly protein PilO